VLELLPNGQTKEQAEHLAKRKAQGAAGLRGCLWQAVALALVLVYAAGYVQGAFG